MPKQNKDKCQNQENRYKTGVIFLVCFTYTSLSEKNMTASYTVLEGVNPVWKLELYNRLITRYPKNEIR